MVGFTIKDRGDSRKQLRINNIINMKKTFMILVLSLLLLSCRQEIKSTDIAKLNGYWEIEKVVFDKGEEKDYGMNESFDYFDIKDNKGIRKKVMPQLDGTFLTSDSFENVAVRFKGDQVFLDYKTDYAKWSEELISISDKELVVKNQEKKEYHYKKAGPLNLLENGKKTK
jgi:hypothetical protein